MVLLDTDIVSHLFRRTADEGLFRALERIPMENRYISAISVGEIIFGYEKAGPERAASRVDMERRFLRKLEILPFDDAAARIYGRIRADLRRANRAIDEPDLRIAAIALARNLTLATGNRQHFGRIEGLRLLDW